MHYLMCDLMDLWIMCCLKAEQGKNKGKRNLQIHFGVHTKYIDDFALGLKFNNHSFKYVQQALGAPGNDRNWIEIRREKKMTLWR